MKYKEKTRGTLLLIENMLYMGTSIGAVILQTQNYIGPTPDVDVIWCYHKWVCPFSNWKSQFVISCIITVEVLVEVSWIFIVSFGCTTSWKNTTLAEHSLWDPMNSAASEGCRQRYTLSVEPRCQLKLLSRTTPLWIVKAVGWAAPNRFQLYGS